MIIVGTDWPMQKSDAATSHQAPHSHSYRYQDSYQVGGSLLAESPLYIPRQADSDLYEAVRAGQMCSVLGSRQTGKSSLRVQVRHRLETQGYCCATLYATQLLDSPQSYYRWEKQLISALWDSIHPSDTHRLRQWLTKTDSLLPQQRLEHFTRDLLASTLSDRPIVIFIDTAEALLNIPFLASDLFDWLWHCHCLKRIYPIYKNLHFVVLGNTTTSELITNKSFLNICQQIPLQNFELAQTAPLQLGFANRLEDPSQILQAILRWTSGHPLLTQKFCAVAKSLMDEAGSGTSPVTPFPESLNQWIDHIAESHIIDRWNRQNDLSYLWDTWHQITQSKYKKQLLTLYQRILDGHPVKLSGDQIQSELLLSGLAIAKGEQLDSANEIHRHIFAALAQR